MHQTWVDLLFAHWPIAADLLRRWVPEPLSINTFDGTAWLAVTPFRIEGLRARGLPALPGLSSFPELNVRTYVAAAKPGVYFFSLDAGNPLAVAFARRFYDLPYFSAEMRAGAFGNGVFYRSRRRRGGAELEAHYEPSGDAFRSAPGTLEHFLTERYCLYTVKGAKVFRTDIDHVPWPLQPAKAEFRRNTMGGQIGITLATPPPLLHFARRLEVRAGYPRLLTRRRDPIPIAPER
jgi:uncharacterized protein YqjF (DUF2071 family)